jgi:hypothetical protein
MKTGRWSLCAALGVVLLGVGPVWAGKPVPAEYQALLRDWYARYLGRPIETTALEFWGEKMEQSRRPMEVEADILASGEYYNRHGQNPASFIRGLFRDVLGTEPSPGHVDYWVSKMHELKQREKVTREFLEAARKMPRSGVSPPPSGPVPVQPALAQPVSVQPLQQVPITTVPAGFNRPLPAYQQSMPR